MQGIPAPKAVVLLLALALPPCGFAQSEALPPPESEQVNVNQADADTLADMLNGIGPAKAQAIVDYRAQHGEFRSLDDLLEVSGIGEGTLRLNEGRIRFD